MSLIKDMKKIVLLSLLWLVSLPVVFGSAKFDEMIRHKYDRISYPEKPAFDIYMKGVIGYLNLTMQGNLSNKELLTIIDFTQSSNNKRIWVIDMKRDSVIYHNLVSHGRNTGNEFAKNFSNVPNSNKSSLGFYVTGENYFGKHGLSLRLDGADPGYNCNARKRAIVMHGAGYVDKSYTKAYGRIGRSFGCPAIPMKGHKQLLKKLADKTCLFIYYPDQQYLQNTELLDQQVAFEYVNTNHLFF